MSNKAYAFMCCSMPPALVAFLFGVPLLDLPGWVEWILSFVFISAMFIGIWWPLLTEDTHA